MALLAGLRFDHATHVHKHLLTLITRSSIPIPRSGPVYRLAYTRAEVSRKADKALERLNLLMRGDNAYKTYRCAFHHVRRQQQRATSDLIS
jgi:hypothetical protein